jgi:hypothetical protein
LQAVEQACQILSMPCIPVAPNLIVPEDLKLDALELRILWDSKCDIYDIIFYFSGLILHALCRHILAPPLTEPVKLFIVPALAELAYFPFRELLEALKLNAHSVPASTWLLFAVLSLEQRHFGKKCYLGFGET